MAPTGHLQVPEPAPFLLHPGDPLVPFRTCTAAFNLWLTLVELTNSEALKNVVKDRLSFGILCSNGLCQFWIGPNREEADGCYHNPRLFPRHCLEVLRQPMTIAHAHFDLRSHRQEPSESADTFSPFCVSWYLTATFPLTTWTVHWQNRSFSAAILSRLTNGCFCSTCPAYMGTRRSLSQTKLHMMTLLFSQLVVP